MIITDLQPGRMPRKEIFVYKKKKKERRNFHHDILNTRPRFLIITPHET